MCLSVQVLPGQWRRYRTNYQPLLLRGSQQQTLLSGKGLLRFYRRGYAKRGHPPRRTHAHTHTTLSHPSPHTQLSSTPHHTQGLSEVIGGAVASSLQRVIMTRYEEAFKATVLPGFEKACQEMFRQIDDAFRRGTTECTCYSITV